MTTPAIEAENLRKMFGKVRSAERVTALDDLSFEVPVGSVLGLLGPNGSGKTTTVSILSTFIRPDSGRAAVCGLDVVADAAEVRKAVDVGTPAQLKARFGTVVFTLGFGAETDAVRAAVAIAEDTSYLPERTGTSVSIRSGDGSGSLTAVLRTLGGNAADPIPDPVTVAVHEPTLDDVFLALTGHATVNGTTEGASAA